MVLVIHGVRTTDDVGLRALVIQIGFTPPAAVVRETALIPLHERIVVLRAAYLAGINTILRDAAAAYLIVLSLLREITRHERHRQTRVLANRLHYQTRSRRHRIGAVQVLLHQQSQRLRRRLYLYRVVLNLQLRLAQLARGALHGFLLDSSPTGEILHARRTLQHNRRYHHNPYTRTIFLTCHLYLCIEFWVQRYEKKLTYARAYATFCHFSRIICSLHGLYPAGRWCRGAICAPFYRPVRRWYSVSANRG